MKIKYLDCKGEHKLFSFSRHDYKEWISPTTGEFFMLDGGEDYSRCSHPDIGKSDINNLIKEDEIDNLIEYIREQFKWGVNFNKHGYRLSSTIFKPLNELSNLHLLNIIQNLYEKDIMQSRSMYFILAELKYRTKNNIIVED